MSSWARLKITLLVLGAVGIFLAGCVRPQLPFQPQPFDVPIESRLILQVPFFGAETQGGAAGALAEVMTYNGRPATAEKIVLALGAKTLSPHALAVWARGEGLKARHFSADPPQLLESVRLNQPLIVRLGAAVPPLESGDYAVVVGYNSEGVVVNSRSINQQIIAWSPFLSGWLKAGNLALEITNDP